MSLFCILIVPIVVLFVHLGYRFKTSGLLILAITLITSLFYYSTIHISKTVIFV